MFEDTFISGAFTKHSCNVYGFVNYVLTVYMNIKSQTLITLCLRIKVQLLRPPIVEQVEVLRDNNLDLLSIRSLTPLV